MNCVIVDDDKISRQIVEEYIKKTEGLVFLKSFTNAIDAINALKKGEDVIDLIFLDVEMPQMSGMDFLASVVDAPQVIIISAKESYALEAFEYSVTDYLLKPISYTRFYKASSKALDRFNERRDKDKNDDEFFIKKRSSLFRIKYDDILFIEALENYIRICTAKTSYTIHFTLKSIFDKLPTSRFRRVHRSYIVNIHKINFIEEGNIIMHTEEGPQVIPIGKLFKETLLEEINLMNK